MKRKVTILRNIGSDFSLGAFKGLKEGQVVDLAEKEADQLLAASLAEIVGHDIDVPAAPPAPAPAHKEKTK